MVTIESLKFYPRTTLQKICRQLEAKMPSAGGMYGEALARWLNPYRAVGKVSTWVKTDVFRDERKVA